MNLLYRVVIGVRRLASPGAAFSFVVLGAALAVEVLGRHSPSDLHDLLAVVALVLVGITVAARHRREPLPWVALLHIAADRAGKWAKGLTFQMGLDMRGTPPVKRGAPPIVIGLGLFLFTMTLLLAGFAAWAPYGIRIGLIRVSYLLYLAGLVAFWISLTATSMLTAFVPLAVIHDTFVSRHRGRGRRSRRAEAITIGAYFGALFMLGAILPLWIAPALSAVFTLVYLVGIVPARRFAVQFLWRPRESIRVRALTWGQWVSCEFVLIGLTLLTLSLASTGALLLGDETAAETMPLTSLLGVTLAWLGPGLLGMLCVQMVMGRLRDPARPAKPVLYVTGNADRATIKQACSQRGWAVRFAPATVESGDVPVELVAQPERRAREWPLPATLADFAREGFFVRLARRDDVQKRRRFFAGLEALLKIAGTRDRGGVGYWLSPHFWFVAGLMRDSRPGEDNSEFDLGEDPILSASVGPPYHRVFPREVRHHLYKILRATQIDLVFIEDGISFKRLRKVLRLLFEVYDLSEGRRPAEEIDFRGLPGTKVMIHDYQFDEPFSSNQYPEPKYEFLGRARILHVFRDRGGDKDRITPPFDWSSRPAPIGAV